MRKVFHKLLSVIITISLVMILLACCDGRTDESELSDDMVFSSSGEQSGILAKAEKYAYQGNDILILHVDNRSDKNYILRITGHFFNADGNELTKQTKKFEGFPAGWQNYFIFQPGISFDSFNYEITTEIFDDRTLADHLKIPDKITFLTGEVLLDSNGNRVQDISSDECQRYVSLWAYLFPFRNTYTEPLRVSGYFVMFDSSGEVLLIEHIRDNAFYHKGITPGPVCQCYVSDVLWENRDQFEIPPYLKNATGLFAATLVSTYRDWR